MVEAKEELKETAKKVEIDLGDIFEDSDVSPEFGEDFIEEIPDDPFDVVEKMPEFRGGMEAFYKFLGTKINYPSRAKRMGTEGMVFVKFIVERDGSLSNLEVVKGIGSGCDAEALRVMGLVPNFDPGKQRGVPVRVQMVVPIHFQLK